MSRKSESGPGEAALKQRNRRLFMIIASLFGVGFVLGFVGSFVEREGIDNTIGSFHPAFAIIASVVTLVAVGWGSWRFMSLADELERRDNYIASTWAANLMLAGYPVWYMLWKGGFVAEPSHEVLFLFTLLTCIAVYGWQKLRR